MAGNAMITIEPSIVAIEMARVVLESATHLYRFCPLRNDGPSIIRFIVFSTSPEPYLPQLRF